MRFPAYQHSTAARNLGTCCLLMIGMPLLGSGQQAGSADAAIDKATIQSLLVEVHQLRMALERTTSLVPRIQLAIQRFQLQQDRVDRLSRELRDFRGQMSGRQANAERLAARLRQLDAETGQIQDANRRKEVEDAMKMMTSELEQGTALEQQQRAQEGDLMSQLQSEQARLSDLSDQLNALDKALQQGSPAPGGNR